MDETATASLSTLEALDTYGSEKVTVLFWALFSASAFLTAIILFREVLQFRKANYWNKIENWLELIMLVLAVIFYPLIFYDPEKAIQVVSFTIIFAGTQG